VDRPVEVKVPVPCDVPEVECASKEELADMNATSVAEASYECVLKYKEAVKVCQ